MHGPATPFRPTRRAVLAGSAALALAAPARAETGQPEPGLPEPGLPEGAPFSFDILSAEMQARAGRPHRPPPPAEALPGRLTYDDWRQIVFRPAAARWTAPGVAFRLHAFHMGWLYGEPVRLFEVADGTLREMRFTADDFDYRGDTAGRFPPGTGLPGVAGFRLNHPLNHPDRFDEVVAFLGASYFRALGQGSAYGLSARGLALDTATGSAEEFPRFSAFYLERPAPGAAEVVLSAALDSPSLTGAFRFAIRPGRTTEMDVTARLFFRADVREIGIAPLTSMFLYDEKNRAGFDDYRPRVHDSNGLRMVLAGGDELWRPLNNPAALANSFFSGRITRFGLHQRGRDFSDYQDAGARYERRPSLEVEPLDDWGAGAVRLVEIPTDKEINDNIVAFWVPGGGGVRAGEARSFRYRLHWGDLDRTAPDALARVVSFKAGLAGVSGVDNPADARKFVIDFAGGPLAGLTDAAEVAPVVGFSAGTLLSQTLEQLPATGAWRLVIDLAAPGEPLVELTAHLAGFGRKLSETWVYQWTHDG
jgi:glucans biosynthesis protein